MAISGAARQRVVTGLWGGRKNGSFAGRIPASLATITGTIFGATEADIVAGGKTIIITLQYDTWAAAGASFNAQRQNIINGIATTHSILMVNQPVTTVVRTSDTVATITLVADALYDIASNDTGTVTVPSSALTNSLIAVVGVPTFEISFIQPVSNSRPRPDDGGRRRRTIFKPTGLLDRPTVEQRIEETAQIEQEVKALFRDGIPTEIPEPVPIETMSQAEIDFEIGVLLHKKIRTEEDELLLLMLMMA